METPETFKSNQSYILTTLCIRTNNIKLFLIIQKTILYEYKYVVYILRKYP